MPVLRLSPHHDLRQPRCDFECPFRHRRDSQRTSNAIALARIRIPRNPRLHRFANGLRVRTQPGVSLPERRQDPSPRISDPERHLASLPECADLGRSRLLRTPRDQHVVRDLVDGPLQSGNYRPLQGHVAHHDVHERIHQRLLLSGITEPPRRQMPVVNRVALWKRAGSRKCAQLVLRKRRSRSAFFGSSTDTSTASRRNPSACARSGIIPDGKRRLTGRKIQDHVLVPALSTFMKAPHELPVGKAVTLPTKLMRFPSRTTTCGREDCRLRYVLLDIHASSPSVNTLNKPATAAIEHHESTPSPLMASATSRTCVVTDSIISSKPTSSGTVITHRV